MLVEVLQIYGIYLFIHFISVYTVLHRIFTLFSISVKPLDTGFIIAKNKAANHNSRE
jgi:hypothetical protein